MAYAASIIVRDGGDLDRGIEETGIALHEWVDEDIALIDVPDEIEQRLINTGHAYAETRDIAITIEMP